MRKYLCSTSGMKPVAEESGSQFTYINQMKFFK